MQKPKHKKQKGSFLVGILVFSSVALIMITGIVSWFSITIKATRTVTQKELAFQIAEAGIDYYRWHLAHAPNDFRDGYLGEEEEGEVVLAASITLEAEDASEQADFSPFEVGTDAGASGGEYIVWPNDGTNQYNAVQDVNLAGQGNYVFYLSDTADVEVELRYQFPGSNDDSIKYILNEQDWYQFNGTQGSLWNTGVLREYTGLAAGQHVLKLVREDDGAQIDSITLTVTGGSGLLSTEDPSEDATPSVAPPQDGLVVWFDAADINGDGTEVSVGTEIVNWQDKSSRNNDLKKLASESEPDLVLDNGFLAARFIDDHLWSNKNLYPTEPVEDTEIYAVVRVSDDTGGTLLDTKGDSVLIKLPNSSDGDLHWNFPDGSSSLQTDWVYSENQYYIWNFQASTTQGQVVRNNGTEVVSDGNSPGLDSPQKLYLGTLNSDSDGHAGMYLRELLVYDKTLTEVERSETERYLRCKWDLEDQSDCDDGDELGLPGETYGPFIHDVFDKNGIKIGEFALMITAPELGSTVVTVQSTGTLVNDSEIRRTILSRLAVPSFAKYAFVANDAMRFGEGTIVRGPVHSNGGVRFDGVAYNVVTSSRENYDDPDHSGGNEFGVHTHVDPIDPEPPADVPSRPDVFVAGREFPVPAVDFAGITLDLADMKELGQVSSGVYIPASSGVGYRIVLKTDDTFDLYEVASYASVPNASCANYASEDDWGTWSVGSETFVDNYDFPVNGIIFVEDHVWIEGQIETAKLTIGAARFPDTPSTHRNIILNDDLLYTHYDGQDVIGLISQNNIHVPLYSPDMLKVDSAMIAQNGRIGRNYYWGGSGSNPGCGDEAERDTIEIHGMIGSSKRYGFAWTDGTGYANRLIDYDPELLYAPPPSFPLTSDAYETIWWEEVKVDDDFNLIGRGI